MLAAVLYVISLSLAIIGALGGALYRLGGLRDREVDEGLGEIDEKLEEARCLGGLYARMRLGDAPAERRKLELPVGEGAIKPEKADATKGGTERPAAGNSSVKEGRNKLRQLSGRDESTYGEALELRLASEAAREYGKYPETWRLHVYASIAMGLAAKGRRKSRRPNEAH